MTQERRILLGRVIGAFGVRGELKLQTFTDPPAAVLGYQPWLFAHDGVEREVSGARGRMTAKGLTITLPGVADRDAAEALAGAEVWVPRGRLPPPKPGEYYWVDLEGLRVVNLEGVEFGRVSHLFETSANDVMVVEGDRQRLLPFLPDRYIQSVDFDAGLITVDWDADF
jgi:16S rRNA processing protein RimM